MNELDLNLEPLLKVEKEYKQSIDPLLQKCKDRLRDVENANLASVALTPKELRMLLEEIEALREFNEKQFEEAADRTIIKLRERHEELKKSNKSLFQEAVSCRTRAVNILHEIRKAAMACRDRGNSDDFIYLKEVLDVYAEVCPEEEEAE